MKISGRSLGHIGLLGGIGGAINAWLCYAKLPQPIGDAHELFSGYGHDFEWHVVPAGLLHGAVLALIIVTTSTWLCRRRPLVRWVSLPVIGWVSGWLSWIPLQLSVFGRPSDAREIFTAFVWPFQSMSVETVWTPYMYFGLVNVVYVALLTIGRQFTATSLLRQILVGSLSGILGSLWWWISEKPWYFSVLHGAIWGLLVGFGVWKAQRSSQNSHC